MQHLARAPWAMMNSRSGDGERFIDGEWNGVGREGCAETHSACRTGMDLDIYWIILIRGNAMKSVIMTICLVIALSSIAQVKAAPAQGSTVPANAPFQFQVPVDIRDLSPDIMGAEIKCVVMATEMMPTGFGGSNLQPTQVPVASGSAVVQITDATLRGINQTVHVDAVPLNEQTTQYIPDANSYECALALISPNYPSALGTVGFGTPPPAIPPYPAGGGWTNNDKGDLIGTSTPTGSMRDPRFEAAANTPFVPVVNGAISGNTP